MSQTVTLFQIFGTNLRLPFMFGSGSERILVTAIIIGEMEMWRCTDYLFPVAESRGGII